MRVGWYPPACILPNPPHLTRGRKSSRLPKTVTQPWNGKAEMDVLAVASVEIYEEAFGDVAERQRTEKRSNPANRSKSPAYPHCLVDV
ncbi:hypothetical protein BDFG_05429 [Blastomyces dermatitidis ATCC 26199]|nr:hypothetical protein BDFG_05429 [Blastomyces dermatitidis ATCC 26199]